MFTTRRNVYRTGRTVPANGMSKIDINFKAHDYHYGVHKIVLREKKLMEADLCLACSPIVMISMIIINYLFLM